MDVEKYTYEIIKEYITIGMCEFKNIYDVKFYEFFCDRVVLRELILYLKKECKIQYIDIQKFFGMSEAVIKRLVN